MKNKIQHLINAGLSKKLLTNLSEGQVNQLHKRMVSEQPQSGITMVPAGDTEKQTQLKQEKKTYQVYEKEIDEDDTLDVVNDPDATEDGMGIFEEDKNRPNAWAICHTQVGPKKSRKWERCVKEVKKQLGEGKNPVSLFLESQIQKIVEKHMPPKITKGDLVRYISEQGTAPSPTTKPAPTKPGVSPGKKPRPSHPGKNPNPGENPAPKAKKVSPEDAKEKVIDVIMQLLEK
jgi:hypothetical protein